MCKDECKFPSKTAFLPPTVCKTVVGAKSFPRPIPRRPPTLPLYPHPRNLNILQTNSIKKSVPLTRCLCVRVCVCVVWGLDATRRCSNVCLNFIFNPLGRDHPLGWGRGEEEEGGKEGAASLLTPQPVSFWIDCRQYHQDLQLSSVVHGQSAKKVSGKIHNIFSADSLARNMA